MNGKQPYREREKEQSDSLSVSRRDFLAGVAVAGAAAGDTSFGAAIKSLAVYLGKIKERPDKYQLVHTAKDIDTAILLGPLAI